MMFFSVIWAVISVIMPIGDGTETEKETVSVERAVAPVTVKEGEASPEPKVGTRYRRRVVFPPVHPPPVAVVKAPGGRQVYIGPRGGRYYLTTGGNKKYLPPAIYEGEIPENSNSKQQ